MSISYSSRATVSLLGFDPDLPPGRLNFDRVLFLDFDGVLHPDAGDDDMYFCFMSNFCDVLRAVDPKGEIPIVVSSDWKLTQTVKKLRSHFPDDIGRQIVGVTSDLLNENDSSADPWVMAGGLPSKIGSREREVLAWMRDFAPAGEWLAIDDRPSYFGDDCPHLFTVPGLYEDEGGGINGMVADDLRARMQAFLGLRTVPEMLELTPKVFRPRHR